MDLIQGSSVEKDGKKYTRVSEILSYFKDFSAIPPHILENKRKIGIDVHTAIEKTFAQEFYPVEENALGYYESFEKWRKNAEKKEWKFVHSEKRFFDKTTYMTGCVDLLMHVPEEEKELVLVDFKTSAQVDKLFWPIQATFYYNLAKNDGLELNKNVLFVKLNKDGKKASEYYYDITEETQEICESMKKVYFYLTKGNQPDNIKP